MEGREGSERYRDTIPHSKTKRRDKIAAATMVYSCFNMSSVSSFSALLLLRELNHSHKPASSPIRAANYSVMQPKSDFEFIRIVILVVKTMLTSFIVSYKGNRTFA